MFDGQCGQPNFQPEDQMTFEEQNLGTATVLIGLMQDMHNVACALWYCHFA